MIGSSEVWSRRKAAFAAKGHTMLRKPNGIGHHDSEHQLEAEGVHELPPPSESPARRGTKRRFAMVEDDENFEAFTLSARQAICPFQV